MPSNKIPISNLVDFMEPLLSISFVNQNFNLGWAGKTAFLTAGEKIPAVFSSHVASSNTSAGRTIPSPREKFHLPPLLPVYPFLSPCNATQQPPAAGTVLLGLQPPRCDLWTKWLLRRNKGSAVHLWALTCMAADCPPVFRIVLNGLGPNLNNQFNPWTSCWN